MNLEDYSFADLWAMRQFILDECSFIADDTKRRIYPNADDQKKVTMIYKELYRRIIQSLTTETKS